MSEGPAIPKNDIFGKLTECLLVRKLPAKVMMPRHDLHTIFS